MPWLQHDAFTNKESHRAKRLRDRSKRDEKLVKSVDGKFYGVVMTQHAVDRAIERSVPKQDIKNAIRTGKVEQTSAKTFRVSSDGVTVVITKEKKKVEGTPPHVALLTTWKTKLTTTKLPNWKDRVVMTQHAVDRAIERSVSEKDIKNAIQTGKVKQTSAETFRVSSDGVTVVIAKEKKRLRARHLMSWC